MIESVIHIIENIVLPLGGFGVFLAEVVEEVIVPIPSAMILLGSGFIFLKGPLTLDIIKTLFFTIVIPASLGLTVGSFIIYYLSYRLEGFFIEKFGKFAGISQTDLDNLSKKFKGGLYDDLLIIFFRVVPLVPSVLLAVFCGIIKMPFKRYALLTMIGAFLRSLSLAIIGWQVGEVYIKYAKLIGAIENKVFMAIIVFILIYLLYRKFYKKVLV